MERRNLDLYERKFIFSINPESVDALDIWFWLLCFDEID